MDLISPIWLASLLTIFQLIAGSHHSAVVSNDTFHPLQRLVYASNHLYAAGTNTVYKIDTDSLQQLQTKLLTEGCGQDCSSQVTALGSYNVSHLFVCVSHRGQCALINNADLTISSRSANNIVTDHTDGTVVFVNAPFVDLSGNEKDAVWITSSYSARGRNAIGVRDPDSFEPSYVIPSTLDRKGVKSLLIYQSVASYSYVYAFAEDNYRFYLKNDNGQSFVAGACDSDFRFNTLVELPLSCHSDESKAYKYIQAAHVSKAGSPLVHHFNTIGSVDSVDYDKNSKFLFAVFANNSTSTSTSVCAFGVKALIQQVEEVFKMCHSSGNNEDVKIGPATLVSSQRACLGLVSNVNH